MVDCPLGLCIPAFQVVEEKGWFFPMCSGHQSSFCSKVGQLSVPVGQGTPQASAGTEMVKQQTG